ncbi:MAG: ATPase, T2SS/T4P/T4SS family, partial [Acidimicrobiia bacterium]
MSNPMDFSASEDAEAIAAALAGEPDTTPGRHGSGGEAAGATPLLSALAAAIDEPSSTLPPPPMAAAPPVAHPQTPAGAPTDWLPAEPTPANRWRPPASVPPPVPNLPGLGTWRRPDAPAGQMPGAEAGFPPAAAPPPPVRRTPGATRQPAPPSVPPVPAARPAAPSAPPPPPFRAGGPAAPPPPFRAGGAEAHAPAAPTVPTNTEALVEYLTEGSDSPLDDDMKERAQNSLLEGLGARLYDPTMTEETMNDLVASHLEGFFAAESVQLTEDERIRIAKEITDDLLRHGPIEPFLADPSVNEIMVNGCKQIYIERRGKLVMTKTQFRDDAQLRRVIERIVGRVGRRIDESSPMVDARLPDGSRVNAIIPPLAVDGPSLTIRKFTADGFTIDDLVRTR